MTGGVRCGGGIGIALALSVTMGWGAPQTSLTAGRMRVAATADRISVSLEGVERFAFPARVAVDTEEGGADRDLFEPAFRQEAGRCVWTSRTTNWEKKEVTLSVEGGAAVLRVTVQGKGKLGKLRFFPRPIGPVRSPTRCRAICCPSPWAVPGACRSGATRWRAPGSS